MRKLRILVVVLGAMALVAGLASDANAQSTTGHAAGAFPDAGTKDAKAYMVEEGGTINIPIELKPSAAGETGNATEVVMMAGTATGTGTTFAFTAFTGGIPDALTFYGPGVDVNRGTATLTVTVTQQRRVNLTAASVVDANGENEKVVLQIMTEDLIAASITAPTAAEMKRQYAMVTVTDAKRPTIEFKEEAAVMLEGQKDTFKLTADLGPEFQHNDNAKVTIEEVAAADGRQRVQLLKSGATYDAAGRLVVEFKRNKTEETFDVQALDDTMADGTDMVTLMLGVPTTGGNGSQLGTMTMMTLEIVDDEGGTTTTPTPTTPTPTPALPTFGAFALVAGLVAAGRRRLRQRLLRQ
jgi:hypothetical protein